MKTKPISPNDPINDIPDLIIETINDLLKKRIDQYEILLDVKEIITIIESKASNLNAATFLKSIDDIIKIYNQHGWKVSYKNIGEKIIWESFGPSISSITVLEFKKR